MKAIPLFISYDTGILQRALADQTQPRVGAILGTKLELSITFLDADGAAVELESGSTGRLVCRAPDAMDGDTILLDSTWDHTADTTLYTLSTLADSEQLRALIKSKSCYTLAAQVEFTIPSETEPRKSLVFDLIIANSAARGDEGAPDVAGTATWDWFKARLAAGDNIAFTTDDTARTIEISATGSAGGGATWGDITGTLSSQTDLQTALNSKASTSHAASHTNGTDDIQSATASQKGLATATQIAKLDGIEALADVTDAANVGSSISGSTAVTTLDDTDSLPIVTATPTLKKIAYSAFKTLLDAMYQAKATILSTFSSLSNAAGVLTNNGSGTLSYTAKSTGGNGTADSGKIPVYSATGTVDASDRINITASEFGFAGATVIVDTGYIQWYNANNAGGTTILKPKGTSGIRTVFLPDDSGTLAVVSNSTGTIVGNLTGNADTATSLSSTVSVASGGTGQTSYTDGQLLIGNTTGNTLDKATLTAGTGITITNGAGSIEIASTSSGGTVTSVAASVPSFLSVSGSPITSSGTLALTYSGTALPVANGGTGITAFGTGIATALGNNVGSAGAPVIFGGDAGTPSALIITNAAGYAAGASVGSATYAYGLGNSSTVVVVSGASPPSAGQVLRATSSTAGNWQSLPVELIIACSDESTALTAGTNKVTFRMPYSMTLTGVRANVTTAPTGSTLVVDINEAGTSVLSTKLSIDATELTSTTAATAAVISDSALANDAQITIDIDQIGSTIAGAGLKVILIGTRA